MACSPVSSLCPAVEGALSDTAIRSSVRLSVPAGLRLRHRLLAAQLSCKQPELCGLRIRRHTDVDPPRSVGAASSRRAITCSSGKGDARSPVNVTHHGAPPSSCMSCFLRLPLCCPEYLIIFCHLHCVPKTSTFHFFE